MTTEIVSVLLFLTLCLGIAWAQGTVEENIHICEKSGNVLFMTDRDYETISASGVDIKTFVCVERVLSREKLWILKRAYKRSVP